MNDILIIDVETEVLYYPEKNEILLFSGGCEVDMNKRVIILYVEGCGKKRWKMLQKKITLT